MEIPCPNCGHMAEQHSAPVRGPSGDGSGLWVCLFCPAIVCGEAVFKGPEQSVCCYADHTVSCHPEAGKQRPTGGGKKNQKGKKR